MRERTEVTRRDCLERVSTMALRESRMAPSSSILDWSEVKMEGSMCGVEVDIVAAKCVCGCKTR